MLAVLRTGQALTAESVERSIALLRSGTRPDRGAHRATSSATAAGRSAPKTLNQKRYVDAIDNNTIVFGIGPAGTGKTYLAVAKAVQALQAKQVNRIVLTRPAVEAGERLGFLPGTLSEKIDPYLRPLYDALHDMIDPDSIPRLMTSGTIEVAPLAYMRGRTLNDSFIILDEAQNTSAEQMKMFLTRLGFGSTMVVTGDITQVDLPGGTTSGLRVVSDILDGIDDVAFCRLTSHDVVRHKLVGRDRRGVRPLRREARRHVDRRASTVTVTNESRRATATSTRWRALGGASCSTRSACTRTASWASPSSTRSEMTDAARATGWTSPGPTDVLSFPMDELRAPARATIRSRASSATSSCARRSRGRRPRPPSARLTQRPAVARHARHAPPDRLRPRHTGGVRRDVRAAGRSAATAGGQR